MSATTPRSEKPGVDDARRQAKQHLNDKGSKKSSVRRLSRRPGSLRKGCVEEALPGLPIPIVSDSSARTPIIRVYRHHGLTLP
mmetsp:Transcript_9691/g.41585  ORF Transcript_9691/g.41585 Transcript_9691/m.41585 type:complete len:83 (+) Transcript_9691:246-494(+)